MTSCLLPRGFAAKSKFPRIGSPAPSRQRMLRSISGPATIQQAASTRPWHRWSGRRFLVFTCLALASHRPMPSSHRPSKRSTIRGCSRNRASLSCSFASLALVASPCGARVAGRPARPRPRSAPPPQQQPSFFGARSLSRSFSYRRFCSLAYCLLASASAHYVGVCLSVANATVARVRANVTTP